MNILERSLTEALGSHRRYEVVALARGHEVLYYVEFGSYSGEWLMLSFCSGEYYVWKGWFGSCSGCDSYEATMGYSDGVTIEQGLAFAKDYAPFIEVPQKTMSNLATNRTMEQIFPANVRSEYGDISWDSAIKDIALIVKLREGIAVTVPDILGCTDAEVKQRALKSYGYENFTKDAGATTEHSDGDNYLLEVGGMKLLSLQDSSTSRRYLLRVPDNIVRVREGIAWTFNMQEDDYFPAKET